MRHHYDRFARRREMAPYLLRLNHLIVGGVEEADLLSQEETEEVRRRSKDIQRIPSWRRDMSFSEKVEPRFQMFVRSLMVAQPSPVYVWTDGSDLCGVPRPIPLARINFGFDFNIDPNGVLALVTRDLVDKLLLDYSEDSNRNQTIVLEVSGSNWGRLNY